MPSACLKYLPGGSVLSSRSPKITIHSNYWCVFLKLASFQLRPGAAASFTEGFPLLASFDFLLVCLLKHATNSRGINRHVGDLTHEWCKYAVALVGACP